MSQAYLQRLMALEKEPLFQHVAVRCICSLLDANPHFNYRESLLEAAVRNISSMDEAIRCSCICYCILYYIKVSVDFLKFPMEEHENEFRE